MYEQYFAGKNKRSNKAYGAAIKAENPYTSKQPLGEEHSFIRIGTERNECDQTVLRIRK
jgi:hypothetical protein